jgi:hypothetical protein
MMFLADKTIRSRGVGPTLVPDSLPAMQGSPIGVINDHH